MSSLRSFVFSLLFLSPLLATANVSITEVAWMGSTDSANHEWIEVYNDGVAVDLTNWQLVIGDKTPIVFEAGERFTGGSTVLGSGEYGVLARTATGNAVPEELYRYSGAPTYALNNAGTSIVLKDASGSVVSEVQATGGWEALGGVADSQYTLQRAGSGWITAVPTPGRVNASTAAVVPTDTSEQSSTNTSNSNSSGSSSGGSSTKNSVANGRTIIPVTLTLPDRTLALRIEQHTEGYIQQPLAFSVKGSGLGKSWLDSLSYQWNFGDGNTVSGDEVTHTFTYPGTYVVSVAAAYKQYSAVQKFEVTILPITLALGRDAESRLLLHNQSPYEVAIAGYQVRSASGKTLFTFPAHSYLSSRQTVAVPKVTGATALQLFNNHSQLLDREVYTATENTRSEITAAAAGSATVVATRQAAPVVVTTAAPAAPSSGRFGFVGQPAAATVSAEEAVLLAAAPSAGTVATATVPADTTPIISTTTQLAAGNQATVTARWWNVAIVVLLLVAVASVYVRPRQS